MTKQQCLACRGIYSPVQADGSSYNHVCASVLNKKTGEYEECEGHRDENLVLVEIPKPAEFLPAVHSARRTPDDVIHYYERRMKSEGLGVKVLRGEG